MNLQDLLSRWDSNEGKPYRGSLIDWDAYEGDGIEPPDDIGCMCAQGQVLHLLGGWRPNILHTVGQAEADRETAKLLNISTAHAILLRQVNDKLDGAPSIVLTHPEKILGDQAHVVLAFWRHLDSMNSIARTAARTAAWDVAGAAARTAAGAAARDAARDAARAAAGAAAGAAAWASNEIQGAAIMRERRQPFFFLPLFGFDKPEDIIERAAS
jgi:hypothetical protein